MVNAAAVHRRTSARAVLVAALLVSAVGLIIQFISEPSRFPAVPPGPLILLAAAAVVAFLPGRWTPIVGVLVALFLTVGMAAAGTGGRLTSPGDGWPFVATWLQLLGQAMALITGTVAVVGAVRGRPGSS